MAAAQGRALAAVPIDQELLVTETTALDENSRPTAGETDTPAAASR